MRKKENKQRFIINMTKEDQKKKKRINNNKKTLTCIVTVGRTYSRHRDEFVLGVGVLRQKEELRITVL